MDNRIQPILCCVGAEVAGEPTQFLMERAASASHWDWHVITVEVSPETLATAWQGMVVMRFRAVRFFPPHQAAAMHLVSAPTAENLFVGGVTSALRTGDTWSMWHNSGPALHELLQARVAWKDTLCWLHGNSARTRSLLAACALNPPRQILWTGYPQPDLALDTELAPAMPPEFASRLPLERIPTERESEIGAWLTQQLAQDSPPVAIVHAGDVEAPHLDTLVDCQPQGNCSLLVISETLGTRSKLSDLWRAGEVTVVTPADLTVAEEAYDLARWTGQSVNIEVLREAYDEYVDF